jgi:hypothetical protein
MPEDMKPKTPNFIALLFYTVMLLAGMVLYFGWSILYGTWADPGIYSIAIVLVGFGLLGVLLYGKK